VDHAEPRRSRAAGLISLPGRDKLSTPQMLTPPGIYQASRKAAADKTAQPSDGYPAYVELESISHADWLDEPARLCDFLKDTKGFGNGPGRKMRFDLAEVAVIADMITHPVVFQVDVTLFAPADLLNHLTAPESSTNSVSRPQVVTSPHRDFDKTRTSDSPILRVNVVTDLFFPVSENLVSRDSRLHRTK